MFRDFPLNRESDSDRLGSYRLNGAADMPVDCRPGGTGLARQVRFRTTRRRCGCTRSSGCSAGDACSGSLSTYFARLAFRHPKPQDFFAVVNEVSGRDMTWFFDQVYRSSNVFDYGVGAFTSERSAPRGYVGDATSRTFSEGSPGVGPFRTTVIVRRLGDGQFPVDVRVVFENKEEVRWRWDGQDRWKLFEIDKPVRAAFG